MRGSRSVSRERNVDACPAVDRGTEVLPAAAVSLDEVGNFSESEPTRTPRTAIESWARARYRVGCGQGTSGRARSPPGSSAESGAEQVLQMSNCLQ